MPHFARHIKATSMLVLLLLLGAGPALRAQVSTGTLSGYVADPTGAIVVGATVTATNLATNIVTSVKSNSSGLFTIPNLPAGNYDVSVMAAGFGKLVVDNVPLNVGEQQAVNFSLKVGSTTEKISVTGAAPTVDLVSAVTMPVVEERTIVVPNATICTLVAH